MIWHFAIIRVPKSIRGRDVLVVRKERSCSAHYLNPGQGCLSFVVDLPRTLGDLMEFADAARAFAMVIAGPEQTSSGSRKQHASVLRNQRKSALW